MLTPGSGPAAHLSLVNLWVPHPSRSLRRVGSDIAIVTVTISAFRDNRSDVSAVVPATPHDPHQAKNYTRMV